MRTDDHYQRSAVAGASGVCICTLQHLHTEMFTRHILAEIRNLSHNRFCFPLVFPDNFHLGSLLGTLIGIE